MAQDDVLTPHGRDELITTDSVLRSTLTCSSSHGNGFTCVYCLRPSGQRHGPRLHERTADAGIDGTIELREPATFEVSNCYLQVRSKASDNDFSGETADRFHYDCDERDLDYWMKSSTPVLLVCPHPKRGEAWWAHIQSDPVDPARRASRRVDFNKITMFL